MVKNRRGGKVDDFRVHWEFAVKAWGWNSPYEGKRELSEADHIEALQHVLDCNHNQCTQAREAILTDLKGGFTDAQETRGRFVVEGGRGRFARITDLHKD